MGRLGGLQSLALCQNHDGNRCGDGRGEEQRIDGLFLQTGERFQAEVIVNGVFIVIRVVGAELRGIHEPLVDQGSHPLAVHHVVGGLLQSLLQVTEHSLGLHQLDHFGNEDDARTVAGQEVDIELHVGELQQSVADGEMKVIFGAIDSVAVAVELGWRNCGQPAMVVQNVLQGEVLQSGFVDFGNETSGEACRVDGKAHVHVVVHAERGIFLVAFHNQLEADRHVQRSSRFRSDVQLVRQDERVVGREQQLRRRLEGVEVADAGVVHGNLKLADEAAGELQVDVRFDKVE
mmetsp:Transcript_3457/g.9857  ORF Transcript_3457/g.9857 Transcript_3457/m.9857 type:complete len:290 (+) Transcript_3457:5843-6712(+)